MMQYWEVVGGNEKGGIVVREAADLKSTQIEQRLSTGALVKELKLQGERLNYKLMHGTGPATGWVSVSLKEKPLVVKSDKKPTSASSPSASSSWKPAAPTGRKIRIMCLHGSAGSEKIFKMQIARLCNALKEEVEFIFVEGHHDVTAGSSYETMQKFFPGMKNTQFDTVKLDDKGWRIYSDPRGTLDKLQTLLTEHSPIDGLIGFSQGANFSAMLCAQAAAGVGAPLGFAVLLCPNAPGYVGQLPDLFTSSIPVPCLIVRGELEKYDAGMEDAFAAVQQEGLKVDEGEVPAAHVAKLFEASKLVAHKEGHRPLPGGSDMPQIIEEVKTFLLTS